MTVHCYTSFTFSYLAKARVLAATLKKHNPDWTLWAVIVDREPDGFTFDIAHEDFDHVLWGHELYGAETENWIAKHNIVEACTAVKARALQFLFNAGASKAVYIDPDIAVFSSLTPIADMLDKHSILLTPHQLKPDQTAAAIQDNEICSLRLGTYNLGFLGVRQDQEGLAFAEWWENRLFNYCHDKPAEGLFVDQKWCDLVPAFFDNVGIIRDPGYNVASWNLSNRHVEIKKNGSILVNDHPLRFYHFTKLGPIGETMTQRYAGNNTDVLELWLWYKRQVNDKINSKIPEKWWYYN